MNMTASISPLSRGLLGLRIGVWLFSYSLFSSLLLAGGAMRAETPYFLFLLVIVGIVLSGAPQAVVTRTHAITPLNRFAAVAIIVVLVTILNAAIDVATLGRSLSPGQPHGLKFYLYGGLQSFAFLVWIHAFYAACVWLVGASQELVDKERRLAEAETAAQRATLDALRSQVNPHFLFNTLNAAASLISTGRNRQAEELIIRLSEFFRSSLSGNRPALTNIVDEFDMLDAYLQIELMRFPGRLEFSMDCPPEFEDVTLPSFLLLPLVENAIKHAVMHASSLVRVSISASGSNERVVLQVENETSGKTAGFQVHGEGLGLKNVAQRLDLIYGPAAMLVAAHTDCGFKVRIEMPNRKVAGS